MTYVDPATLEFQDRLLNAGDTIARRFEITDDDVEMLAENAMWGWAQGCRYPVMHHSNIAPLLRDLAVNTLVFATPARLNKGRYRLRATVRGAYLTPQILVKTRAGVLLTTWTGSSMTTLAYQFADIPVGSLVGDEDVIIELWLQNNTQATELEAVRVLESYGELAPFGTTVETLEGLEMSITATTYNLLPTVSNGFGTPADGAYGEVTTTAGAGVYTYVDTVDTYTVDMWLPSDVVARGLSYVKDASSNPWRLSAKIGAESKTDLTSRGWTATVSGTSTIADTGDQIEMDTTTSSPNAAYMAIPGSLTPGDVFCVYEVEAVSRTGGAEPDSSCAIGIYDGVRRAFISFYSQGSQGRMAYSNLSAVVGSGLHQSTAYERIFAQSQIGTVANGSQHWDAWSADDGKKTGGSRISALASSFTTTALTQLFLYCDCDSGERSIARFREVHVFALGTP